jgi:DNA-3-methyladenine glycosylase
MPAPERLEPVRAETLAGPAPEVAQGLLGLVVVRASDDGVTAGRIVEVEAYHGPGDLASHARAGRTARTSTMFGPPGRAYVYLVYGMHSCLNVVTDPEGDAGAVLIRALEPVHGIAAMRRRRGRAAEPDVRLAAGPARLCQALAIDRTLDGHDLTVRGALWLADPGTADMQAAREPGIIAGPRVGVDYAGDHWASRPWRFGIRDHPALSRPFRPRPAGPVPRRSTEATS